MPRIPVRTEPYTSPTRQHRHFKSKRDLILRTLGKSSYINHSQFLICFLSAKGEIETYASEMLQDSVEEVLDMEVLSRLAVQVREGADRKREQLEELQRKRGEEGDEEELEPAEVASQVLRSAKKAKAERVAAEKAMASLGMMEGIEEQEDSGSSRKGKERARDPPMTPLRQVQEDMTLVPEDEGEDEDEDEYEEEDEQEPKLAEPIAGGLGMTEVTLASVNLVPFTEPKKEEAEHSGDITLVDTPSLATSTGGSVSLKQKLGDTPRTAPLRQVQVTMTGSPLSLRTMAKGSTSKRGMLMSATPTRPTLMASEFVTPSMRDVVAPTPKSGRGLMNNVLESASAKKKQPKIMLGPSLVGDKPHIPRPLAHIRTPSHATIAPTGTPYTPSVQTRSITIRYRDLIDWYANRFDSLQQATCKLVVKAWIKVIEPKKQSKFPYNRGEDCRPDWWPEHIRHREPDHLQKPERTQILISLIRSSLAPISKLELSTAEQTAHISQPRMKILRDIYKVAKEDEKRRAMGDETSDLVVHVPLSPPLKTSDTRMSILDEIAQQMDEPKPGRRQSTTTGEFREPRDLASPCIIMPSALSTRHAKTGSIGESVFLGAGALKKRKMDALTADKENIDPQGRGKVPKSMARQQVPTTMRPQSTGALRKQPEGRQLIVPPGMMETASPMVPPTTRPWSTTGARPSNMQWTTDTPMNHRQRVQQGEGIARPMSIDSAPSRVGHGFFGNGMPSNGMGMNPHLGQGIHHPSPIVSAGMDMYLTTDPHAAHPPSLPVHHTSRGSFTIHQDAHAQPTMQYIPYGMPPHGMPPFSSVPQEGTFMVYDPPHGSASMGPSGPRRYSQQHASVPRHGQANVYPQYTPYGSLYVPAEHEMQAQSRGMYPDSQGPMLSYPTGMTLLAEEEAIPLGEERVDKRTRRTGGGGSVEVGRGVGGMVTAHLGMTISLPIRGMSTADATAGKDVSEPIRMPHDLADQTTPPRPTQQADGTPINPMDPASVAAAPSMTVNPTNVNPTPSEMDKVEREFVKFSDADGSDREGFWGNDSL